MWSEEKVGLPNTVRYSQTVWFKGQETALSNWKYVTKSTHESKHSKQSVYYTLVTFIPSGPHALLGLGASVQDITDILSVWLSIAAGACCTLTVNVQI